MPKPNVIVLETPDILLLYDYDPTASQKNLHDIENIKLWHKILISVHIYLFISLFFAKLHWKFVVSEII